VNHRLATPAVLVAFAVVPFSWLACGGGKKPPNDPSSDDSGSSASTSDTSTPTGSADMTAPPSDSSPPAASTASTPPPPPPPGFSDTDCGKCVATTCAKQETACGKDATCKSALDAIHSCITGSLGTCVDGATPPTDKAPKKLAAAYVTCADKAGKKACKAQCK
jgi:hypothetical protein